MRKFFCKEKCEQNELVLLRTFIAVCPLLAVAATAKSGLILGLSAIVILVLGGLIVSLLKGFVPENAAKYSSLVVYATLTCLLSMLVNAYAIEHYAGLELGFPLLAVAIYYMTGAGEYATSNCYGCAAKGGFAQGLVFAVVLFAVAAIREMYGNNSMFGYAVFGADFNLVGVMTLFGGGLIVSALFVAAFKALTTVEEGQK